MFQAGDAGFIHRLKRLDRGESLVQKINSDQDGYRKIQRVAQAIHRFDYTALENDATPEALHTQNADLLLDCRGYDQLREAAEVSIHNIDRHLGCVEVEAMLLVTSSMFEMNMGICWVRSLDRSSDVRLRLSCRISIVQRGSLMGRVRRASLGKSEVWQQLVGSVVDFNASAFGK